MKWLALPVFGGATAWNAGTVGPAANAIAAELGLSLAAVGALGGSVFLGGLIVSKLGAAALTDRLGITNAIRACLLAAVAGNVLTAALPDPVPFAAGRVLTGVSCGLAIVLGPLLSRQIGGERLVGVFGAGITVGTGLAIGLGSLGRDAGIDWRLDFLLAAAVAIAALVMMPTSRAPAIETGSLLALSRRAVRSANAWKVELLFMTSFGVPYLLAVWLVPYLTRDVGLSFALAGVLGLAMYATNAIFRPEGARMLARRAPLSLLGGGASLLAAAGLSLLAIGSSPVTASAGVIAAGIGFAIPYATMYEEARTLFPEAKVAASGLFSVGANVVPALVMPVVGSAVSAGHGELAILAMAAFALFTGAANLVPAAPYGEPESPARVS